MAAIPETRHAASKHEAVFRAAKAVFLTHGYEGASMDEVARLAGATKATVYAHAGSKADLFRLTVRESVALASDAIMPVDRQLPPVEALSAFCARFIEISCWQAAAGLQRTVFATLDQFPEHGRLIFDRVIAKAVSELASYLAERHVPDPAINASLLLESATAARRFRVLLGVEAALPLPPSPDGIQSHATDEYLKISVADFCTSHGL